MKPSYLKFKIMNDVSSEETESMEREDEERSVEMEVESKRTKMSLRGGSGGAVVAPPRCTVESCGADMRGCKKYYQKHKVCEVHAKAPVVLHAGVMQRFCQQCSRFHELSEFDQEKRSCRKYLAGHNERRRRRKSSADSQKEGWITRRFEKNPYRQLYEQND